MSTNAFTIAPVFPLWLIVLLFGFGTGLTFAQYRRTRDQLDRMLVQDIIISGAEAQPQIAVIAKCKLKDGSFRDMALTTWQIGKNADGKWRLRGASQ